ncbi:DGQHR domain-containing protein [Mucilaginibacter sp.]|jgi:DGQHR domain-containing protein|uniref:DGQHR domain-containing protein n=1 Tax=Mucilaginibacter sp. TaxID=1882438 RepID=UPI002BECA887|nr:DGQHR domain-containing protein [Mucilaginibacter sp.]HTI61202.1 DGQHR domain-containing protein [Mucilaginibacter sp.]
MTTNQITLPVIKVSQPLGDFFIGNISAKDLIKISYADVRRIEDRDIERYLGIQRPLDKGRVAEIRRYLDAPDAAFPTGVVLAIDQNCAEFGNDGALTLKPFTSEFEGESISVDKIAKILDGQHRIAAFINDAGSYDRTLDNVFLDFQLNVVIFIGLDIDEQANIFATVNLAQTKVSRSLVYDLEGLAKVRSPFKTCHQIAVALDSADKRSPLYHRIKRLGVKTKGREASEPLTQAAFVESLIKLISPDPFSDRTTYLKGKKPEFASNAELFKNPFRNLFISERDNDIALILFNYFTSIQNKWPVAWTNIQQEGNILPRSNAFKAFMRYLKLAYIRIVQTEIGRIASIEEFASIFENLNVSDADFTSGNFKPGSGGESAFYKLLTGEKTIHDLKDE